MFNLGLDELLIVGILAAFFLDAKKIAQAFKWIRITRHRLNNLQYDIEEKVDNYLNMSEPPQKTRQIPGVSETPPRPQAAKALDTPAFERGSEPSPNTSDTSESEISSSALSPQESSPLDSNPKDDTSDDRQESTSSGSQVAQEKNTLSQDQARDMVAFRMKLMDEDDIEDASDDLLEELETLPCIDHSQVLAAFMPLKDEPQILPFLEQWIIDGKTLLLPRVDGEDMTFHLINSLNDLQPGAFRILEPDPKVSPQFNDSIPVFLIPGVAFSEEGVRVGRGKGFYDRFLKKHPQAVKVGICFEKQVLNGYIAQNSWDVPMDYIVSSRRTIHATTTQPRESQI